MDIKRVTCRLTLNHNSYEEIRTGANTSALLHICGFWCFKQKAPREPIATPRLLSGAWNSFVIIWCSRILLKYCDFYKIDFYNMQDISWIFYESPFLCVSVMLLSVNPTPQQQQRKKYGILVSPHTASDDLNPFIRFSVMLLTKWQKNQPGWKQNLGRWRR